ncbi:MAG: agmatinase [Dehalococcoidia bacterium]
MTELSPDREPAATGHSDAFMQPRVFAGLTPPYSDLQGAQAVVLPVPYDMTSEWRSGSRHGPQAIIDASQYLELYDIELDCEISEVGICTLPDVEPHLNSPQEMVERVFQVTRPLAATCKLLVLLGGEHSLSLGAVRAYREVFPRLSVLQLDAHADLRDEYLGTRYGQACVMRRIAEVCPVSQVGVRSLSLEEKRFITQQNMAPFYASDLASDPGLIDGIIESLSEDVYITIDVDVLDPSTMPATGTPEPDGMSWKQVLDIVRSVAVKRRVVAFDLVEFCPPEGPHSCAYLLAKLAYKLIGYCLVREGK